MWLRLCLLRDYLDTVRFEWQELALIVDRTLLLAFVLVTFAATVIILLQAPLSTQFLFGHHESAAEVSYQQAQANGSVK